MKSFASVVAGRKPAEPVKSKITNERQTVIKKFLDRLNASRVGQVNPKTNKPLKQLTPAFVGMRMRFMTTKQLYEFYGYCDEAKNFSATWFWKLNPKNYVDK